MERKNEESIFTDYRLYLAINTVLFIVIIILLVLLIRKVDKPQEAQKPQTGVQDETMTADDTALPIGTQDSSEEDKLEESSSASVYRVIEKYCNAIAGGDVEALEAIVDFVPEEEKAKIRNRAAFIEEFQNITCYTKKGPDEGSLIVFVCYDMKLINIEVSAPDIICLYVGPKEADGERKIRYGGVDDSMSAYMAELEKDPDIQALYNDVRTRYQAAQESDATLAAFIQRINGQVAPEAPQEEPTQEPVEEPAQTAPAESSATAQNRETRVTETVNVRSDRSTEASKLTLAYQGDAITQVESYGDGWSKVEYKGITGYVKTEFLE